MTNEWNSFSSSLSTSFYPIIIGFFFKSCIFSRFVFDKILPQSLDRFIAHVLPYENPFCSSVYASRIAIHMPFLSAFYSFTTSRYRSIDVNPLSLPISQSNTLRQARAHILSIPLAPPPPTTMTAVVAVCFYLNSSSGA